MPNTPRAKLNLAQTAVVLAFAGLTATVAQAVYRTGGPGAQTADATEAQRCTVPAFAKAIGHEEKWKMHNNCQ